MTAAAWLPEFTKVVSGFMTAGQMFTSVNVCNELRSRGIDVRNTPVAQMLRDSFLSKRLISQAGPSYNRQLIAVQTPTGSAETFLYFPLGADTDTYQERDIKVCEMVALNDPKPIRTCTLGAQIIRDLELLRDTNHAEFSRKDLPQDRQSRTSFTQAKYFDLIEKGRTQAHWRLTTTGYAFLDGRTKVPRVIKVQDDVVISREGTRGLSD